MDYCTTQVLSWLTYYLHNLKFFHLPKVIEPLLDVAPKDVAKLQEASLLKKLLLLRNMVPLRKAIKSASQQDIAALSEIITAPISKTLNQWFCSEPLKATLATDASIGAMSGPHTLGGGYVLLHHVMGELDGVRGAWGYPRGGMGAVSQAIARSAEESGAEVIEGQEVKEILVENGRAIGVLLENQKVRKRLHKQDRYCVILNSPDLSSFCFAGFEKWGRTTGAKTMIPTGRDCELGKWIKN